MSQNNYDYMIEILVALKDGKTIQFQNMDGVWYDVEIENYVPNFETDEYRIKPDIKSYRIAIMTEKDNRVPIIVYSKELEDEVQTDPRFVCWHTDWMDY